MDSAPQSTRSSASPDPYQPTALFIYPSPVLSEASASGPYPQTSQGLGLYSCRASPFHGLEDSLVPGRADLATDWTASALQARRVLRSPNIFPTDQDLLPPSMFNMISTHSPSLYTGRAATGSAPSSSPALSCIDSNRSSISSTASEPYPFSDHYHVPHPHIKMEDQIQEWSVADILSDDSQAGGDLVIPSVPTFPGSFETNFFAQQDPMAWAKSEPFGDNVFADALTPRPDMMSHSSRRGQERRRASSAAIRTKAPRKMTSQEDANFQCSIKGCGKLFSRSYNYKAHLETHSSNREYPFPCEVSSCTRKFVRKTDLQRHHASVHEKTRNYQCDFCSRFFARKDTLRRHMEDGCPKRFDLNMSFSPSYPAPRGIKAECLAEEAHVVPSQSQYVAASTQSFPARPPREFSHFGEDYMGRDYSNVQGQHSWREQ